MPAQVFSNLQSVRRNSRFNPLRSLTAQSLTFALEGFEAGDLRQAALLWDAMAKRDDTISSVKAKREKAVSNRQWEILQAGDSPEAQKHKEVLEAFWNNISTVNAYDRNERGGIARLIRQMMEAASFRYAAHHIVWKPKRGDLGAEFEYVPLWFFENHTGNLRFIENGIGYEGKELDPAEWCVTCGDGVMIAACIAYFAKRFALQDWQIFCEKFGVPGILGRTPHGAGTDGGNAMADAVESISNDWSGVVYGDDGVAKEPISLITVSGGASTLPFPLLIERIDRKIAALYRGADLSSMSAGSGAGDGASLQGEEGDLIEADDARMISESLQRIEKQVIAWHFGAGVKPLAYFEIILPSTANAQKEKRENLKLLYEIGVPIGIADARESLGVATPDDDEDTVVRGKDAETVSPGVEKKIQKPLSKSQNLKVSPSSPDAPDAVETDAAAWEERLTDFITKSAAAA